MSFSCLNSSNVFLCSLHACDLQVKLWTIIGTQMSIGRKMARICAASVKCPSGINGRALKAPGVGAPAGRQLFHVKRPNVRSAACAEQGSSGSVARSPCGPILMAESIHRTDATMRAERGRRLVNRIKSRRRWQPSVRTGTTPSCTHTTMTKRDDKSLAEQNAEIRRWAEENGFTVGSRLGEKQDAVELVAPRVPVVEFTVHIDEDVYEAAMLRATYDGYDNASEVVEAALREWARGY